MEWYVNSQYGKPEYEIVFGALWLSCLSQLCIYSVPEECLPVVIKFQVLIPVGVHLYVCVCESASDKKNKGQIQCGDMYEGKRNNSLCCATSFYLISFFFLKLPLWPNGKVSLREEQAQGWALAFHGWFIP